MSSCEAGGHAVEVMTSAWPCDSPAVRNLSIPTTILYRRNCDASARLARGSPTCFRVRRRVAVRTSHDPTAARPLLDARRRARLRPGHRTTRWRSTATGALGIDSQSERAPFRQLPLVGSWLRCSAHGRDGSRAGSSPMRATGRRPGRSRRRAAADARALRLRGDRRRHVSAVARRARRRLAERTLLLIGGFARRLPAARAALRRSRRRGRRGRTCC